MISINNNIAAMAVLNNIDKTSNQMNKTLEQLSSGYRINNASDGAAEYAIVSKLIAQKGSLGAAQNNTAQATAMVKMADGAATQIQTMVERLKTLATTAASANTASELAPLEAERVKLETQITNIAQSITYNGKKLLDGTGGASTFQVGANNTAADQVTVAFNNAYDSTTLGLGVAQAPIVAGVMTATAGTFATQTDAQAYMATLDTALNTVIQQRADLGSTVNVLGFVSSNLSTSISQLGQSISSIRDADMAKLTSDKAKFQVMQQAQMSMLVQSNQSAKNLMTLFR